MTWITENSSHYFESKLLKLDTEQNCHGGQQFFKACQAAHKLVIFEIKFV